MKYSKNNPSLLDLNSHRMSKEKESILENLRSSIIGDFCLFKTPFGLKPLVYADYVASARGVDFIEKYIAEVVLPFYANTHTYTSYVGAQTGTLREEARQIIKNSLHATSEDTLLFVGSGSTGAINKLVTILKDSHWGSWKGYFGETLKGKIPCLGCEKLFETEGPFLRHLDETHPHLPLDNELDKPVVFVAVYEHHSNILPWREAGCDVVFINDDTNGMLDLSHLRSELIKYSNRKNKLGSFSACSNVTGILTDVHKVTDLLKEFNALSFYDYAAGAPYLVMDMNPAGHEPVDGIVFSGHKLVGGPGTPGVLCIKRKLLGNSVPTQTGGGTVFFVTDESHMYLKNPEEKEEGGTPDILGSIRLGLVFVLKNNIGSEFIYQTEVGHYRRIVKKLMEIPNFVLLGSEKAKRLPIFSFLIKHGERFLHYGFVSALLNDLFGIETRGGCACAGPYALRLLGISNEKAERYREARLDGYELFVPGFSRLSINYFFSEETIEYIYRAIRFVCKYGLYFLPLYKFVISQKTASYIYSSKVMNKTITLNQLNMKNNKEQLISIKKIEQSRVKEYIKAAFNVLSKIKTRTVSKSETCKEFDFPEHIEELRWFVLPSEAAEWVIKNTSISEGIVRKDSLKMMVLENEFNVKDFKLPMLQVGHNVISPQSKASNNNSRRFLLRDKLAHKSSNSFIKF